MATEKIYYYDNLSAVTNSGLEVAEFYQIRDAIVRRMMEIYGEDIDVSSASADGEYINMEADIINNIYKSLENFITNLNPYTASGKFLDVMCSLSNIYRRLPSKSTAQVYVKNISGNELNNIDQIDAVDRSGITWTWINNKNYDGTFETTFKAEDPGNVHILEFVCSQFGPVSAEGTGAEEPDWNTNNNGWIYKTIDAGNFNLYQSSDAVLGNFTESDSSLRARRYNFIGSNSITTQASLEGALYSLDSIVDVFVFNNNTGINKTMLDNTEVLNHNVYVVLRYKNGVTISDSTIGNIIYNKLTPGVVTQEPDSTVKSGKSHTFTITKPNGINTVVYWKEAIPITPKITINYQTNSDYVKELSEESIKKFIMSYTNNIEISSKLHIGELQSVMLSADLRPNGISTFWITSGNIEGNNYYEAPNTYYNYTDKDFVFTPGTNGSVTLVIGK